MIRSVTKEDIPNIRKLMESEPGFWQESWRYDVLERGLDSAGGLAFVWEETGQILGFVCAHDLGFRGYLSELIVAKSARNRGIGKHLVQQVEQKLAARGCNILISDVWEDSVRFYKLLGWSEPDIMLLRKPLV